MIINVFEFYAGTWKLDLTQRLLIKYQAKSRIIVDLDERRRSNYGHGKIITEFLQSFNLNL